MSPALVTLQNCPERRSRHDDHPRPHLRHPRDPRRARRLRGVRALSLRRSPAAPERSRKAAAGALADQGVQVSNQDRTPGVIEGRRGDLTVRARVITQADGAVRVEFNTTGSGADSQNLSAQVSRAYDVRMGR